MSDPTDTWRATFAASGLSASTQLRQTQAALAASQADLTAMQAQRNDWKSTADQIVADIRAADEQIAAIEKERDEARAEVRRLEAELGSALAALNEKEGKS